MEENKGKDSFGQDVDWVGFTESGTPFYDPAYNPNKPYDGKEYCPWRYYVGVSEIRTHLPWHVDYSYHDSKMISSTRMVWWWQQQQYTEYTNPREYPYVFTRYYDGSP